MKSPRVLRPRQIFTRLVFGGIDREPWQPWRYLFGGGSCTCSLHVMLGLMIAINTMESMEVNWLTYSWCWNNNIRTSPKHIHCFRFYNIIHLYSVVSTRLAKYLRHLGSSSRVATPHTKEHKTTNYLVAGLAIPVTNHFGVTVHHQK